MHSFPKPAFLKGAFRIHRDCYLLRTVPQTVLQGTLSLSQNDFIISLLAMRQFYFIRVTKLLRGVHEEPNSTNFMSHCGKTFMSSLTALAKEKN